MRDVNTVFNENIQVLKEINHVPSIMFVFIVSNASECEMKVYR